MFWREFRRKPTGAARGRTWRPSVNFPVRLRLTPRRPVRPHGHRSRGAVGGSGHVPVARANCARAPTGGQSVPGRKTPGKPAPARCRSGPANGVEKAGRDRDWTAERPVRLKSSRRSRQARSASRKPPHGERALRRDRDPGRQRRGVLHPERANGCPETRSGKATPRAVRLGCVRQADGTRSGSAAMNSREWMSVRRVSSGEPAAWRRGSSRPHAARLRGARPIPSARALGFQASGPSKTVRNAVENRSSRRCRRESCNFCQGNDLRRGSGQRPSGASPCPAEPWESPVNAA